MKITWNDIVRKLTGWMLWAAVAAFVTGGAEAIATLNMVGARVGAYILGEGLADAGSHALPMIGIDETVEMMETVDEDRPTV